jgi:archaellum component FlaC
MEEQITNEHIVNGLGVLAENQGRINVKIDSILDFVSNQHNQINEMKEVMNQQSQVINILNEKIININLKLSDLQIQNLNSSSDMEGFTNDINNISIQIEEVKQLLNQWKVYSEI